MTKELVLKDAPLPRRSLRSTAGEVVTHSYTGYHIPVSQPSKCAVASFHMDSPSRSSETR